MNKERKIMRSTSEEKVVGFSSGPAISRKEMGGRYPTRRIPQIPSIKNGCDAKQNDERIPDTFTYKNDTIADPSSPQKKRRGKHEKVGVKRNRWILAYPPYSPQGNKGSHPG